MDNRFATEVVLVTGASSGIGLATARIFARGGARLVLAARRRERLDALAKELAVPSHVVTLDVRDGDAVRRAIAELPGDFANVTTLINNAGLALGLDASHEADIEQWQRMIDTNVTGLVHVTRAVLPGMVARKRGTIVNLGSVAGSYAYPGGNVYGASKAFVEQFSRNLRADLLGKAIRVISVEPGLVGGTEFSNVRLGDDARAAAVYGGTVPLGPDDIADVIAYCVGLPPRVNINRIEIMPTCQAFGPLAVLREP